MRSLFSSVYDRFQNVLYYSCSLVNEILYPERNNQSQKIILEKINLLEKKIFPQFLDVTHQMDQMSRQIGLLQKKLEDIDNAQIYLREEMENVSRYKDIESITRCRSYVKKIKKNLSFVSIALEKKFTSHQPISSSTCSICRTLLNTFKNNLTEIQHYIELATPYLHSFRSHAIRSQLLEMFGTNSVLEAIASLSIFEETDQEKSCRSIQKILNRFSNIFFNINEEIMEIQFYLDESIREEQERRPSLQKLNIYQI